jgi:hypothetical protein
MAYALLPSGALVDATGNGTLPDGGWLVSAAGGAVTAAGASLAGAGSIAAGAASGDGGTPVTAPGSAITGTAFIVAGAASGGAATGSLTSAPMENNAGSLLAGVHVLWTWWLGAGIGADPTSLVHGSGTTSAGGVLSLSGLPAGAGLLLVRTDDGSGVYYQPGTVA